MFAVAECKKRTASDHVVLSATIRIVRVPDAQYLAFGIRCFAFPDRVEWSKDANALSQAIEKSMT